MSDTEDEFLVGEEFYQAGLRPKTSDRYSANYQKFEEFCSSKGYVLSMSQPSSDDALLLEMLMGIKSGVTFKNDDGEIIYVGAARDDIVAAVRARNPNFRPEFSLRFLSTWKREHAPFKKEARVLNKDQVWSLLGYYLGREEWERALLVSFLYAGWLRLNEALSLRRDQVVITEKAVVIRLCRTKTQSNDSVILEDDEFTKVLLILLFRKDATRARHRGASNYGLFSFTSSSARRALDKGFSALELNAVYGSSSKLSSHTFRRSAATAAFLQGFSTRWIMLRGRWRNADALSTYVRAGAALISTGKDEMGLRFLREAASKFAALNS